MASVFAMTAHPIVHVNALLNAIATVLLVLAFVFIKMRWERAHRNAMFAALGVSAAFLCCYLWYHYHVGSVRFTRQGVVRYIYFAILASHVVLAITVPFLALWAAWLGTKAMSAGEAASLEFRKRHKQVVRWAYPIWLYVSVTGVLVYLMLYIWFPPPLTS
jgi:uncharacterized membrane protein YozB (DUF420 family)